MKQMMFDIETLDTKQSAIVLSVGAVVWETVIKIVSMPGKATTETRTWDVMGEFYGVLDIDSQVARGRTISESTMLWWLRQDPTARSMAFDPLRSHAQIVAAEFNAWAMKYVELEGLTRFWASPACFDFPIWENLVDGTVSKYPWDYNRRYDVRSVVNEANYSANSHMYLGEGIPHTPIWDCKFQIDMLVAAQSKLRNKP